MDYPDLESQCKEARAIADGRRKSIRLLPLLHQLFSVSKGRSPQASYIDSEECWSVNLSNCKKALSAYA